MIHSKFAEAAPHAVLSQVPQDRTRVLFCTRWTGATSLPTSHHFRPGNRIPIRVTVGRRIL